MTADDATIRRQLHNRACAQSRRIEAALQLAVAEWLDAHDDATDDDALWAEIALRRAKLDETAPLQAKIRATR